MCKQELQTNIILREKNENKNKNNNKMKKLKKMSMLLITNVSILQLLKRESDVKGSTRP